jgi:acyl-CoA reductase-like NAD-dependent aldehyde dehydrogenase
VSKEYPIYLAGDWVTSSERLEVSNPYTGDVVGTTFQATVDQLNTAIGAAEQAFGHLRTMLVFDRVSLLDALACKMREQRDTIARTIAQEAGKPIRDAEVETDRGVFTVETAAEEAKRIAAT